MWNRVACYCGVVAGNLRRRTLGRACLLRFVVPSGKLPSLPSGTGPKLSVCQCVCVCVCRCPCCSPTRTPPASSAVRSADRPFCFAGPAPFTHRLQSRDTRPVPGERLHPPSVCAVQCSAVAEELNKHSAVGFSLSLSLCNTARLSSRRQAKSGLPALRVCISSIPPGLPGIHTRVLYVVQLPGALTCICMACPRRGKREGGERGRGSPGQVREIWEQSDSPPRRGATTR